MLLLQALYSLTRTTALSTRNGRTQSRWIEGQGAAGEEGRRDEEGVAEEGQEGRRRQEAKGETTVATAENNVVAELAEEGQGGRQAQCIRTSTSVYSITKYNPNHHQRPNNNALIVSPS